LTCYGFHPLWHLNSENCILCVYAAAAAAAVVHADAVADAAQAMRPVSFSEELKPFRAEIKEGDHAAKCVMAA